MVQKMGAVGTAGQRGYNESRGESPEAWVTRLAPVRRHTRAHKQCKRNPPIRAQTSAQRAPSKLFHSKQKASEEGCHGGCFSTASATLVENTSAGDFDAPIVPVKKEKAAEKLGLTID